MDKGKTCEEACVNRERSAAELIIDGLMNEVKRSKDISDLIELIKDGSKPLHEKSDNDNVARENAPSFLALIEIQIKELSEINKKMSSDLEFIRKNFQGFRLV